VLESFDGEHAVEPQCSSINPQVIANHGGLSQGKDFGNAGPGRQSTWSTGSASQCGRRVVAKPSQRIIQQQLRSSTIKNTSSLGDKSASILGQEMRSAAQQVRTFGGQLLDVKRYLQSSVDQCPDLTISVDATRLWKKCRARYPIFRPEHLELKKH
jgi:hypothetical protein